ncbi:MAG: hypothetical protein QOF56_3596 [Acidobacteriaceae bacterium]|jgi:hypothetical protein|nr:hypothetical protein [Acidobacteriaceae bacterium]
MIYFVGVRPRVDRQGLPGSSSLPCDLHCRSRRPEAGACQKADSRDCQDVECAIEIGACAQASAGSGEIGGQLLLH